MKKTATILLLFLLFYTQLGYYGQFLFLQWQLKEAAREACIAALPDDALFRVQQTDVDTHGKWEEAGKECWYNDHLYDVIRQKNIDGKTWLFCLDDDNEERLIRRSGEFSHTGAGQSDKKTSFHLSIRIGDLLFDTVDLPIGLPSRLHASYYAYNTHSLPTCYTEISIPPPKG